MARVMVMSPPGPDNFMRNGRCDFVSWSGCQWWPIILGYLAQYLRAKGHEITFIDAQAWGKTRREILEHLREVRYDFIVMMINSSNISEDMLFAGAIGILNRVILVGPATTLHATLLEQHGFDFVMGEPEHGVQYIIEGIVKGKVRGIPLTQSEFSQIPAVSRLFSTFDAQHYVAPSEPHPFVDIMTARGCAYGKCSFCVWPKTYARHYTPRNIGEVLSELKFIQDYGKFKSVMIQDDTLPEERAIELSEAIILNNHLFRLPWSCYVRADITKKTLELMKRARCLNIHVGYESGNDETLERTHKGITTSQMKTFTKNAKSAGLNIHGDFMIGIDRTLAEIRKTVNFACALRPHTAQFQVYIPFLGEKPSLQREELEKLARKAYRKFYGNPMSWPAIAQQIGKPRVFKQAMEAVCKTS